MENKLLKNSRREFIKKGALLTVAATAFGIDNKSFSGALPLSNNNAEGYPYSLPPLPYEYAALEPHIDTLTMQIHHDKHHAAYVTNLNKALKENSMEDLPMDELIKNVAALPPALRNNGGGHWNHSMFWKIMKPGGSANPTGELLDAINASFGTFDVFKKKFNDAATGRFGSGWAWLVKQGGKLLIGSTPNQDNPLMDVSEFKGAPVLCLDVWEHAYYLHYQNKRADYIASWWNVVNWDEVTQRFKEAK